MAVNNVAFKKGDEKVESLIKEVFRNLSIIDLIPLEVNNEELISILSIEDTDINVLESIAKKNKCNISVNKGFIAKTSIPVIVLLLRSE